MSIQTVDQGKMILLLLLGWLLAFPAMALPGKVNEVYNNFSHSCNNISLNNTHLHADCLDLSGNKTYHNDLILPLCVGIDFSSGNLAWEIYGKFDEYCHACQLVQNLPEPPIMSCVCKSTNTTLALDEGISNKDGTLNCNGGNGNISH